MILSPDERQAERVQDLTPLMFAYVYFPGAGGLPQLPSFGALLDEISEDEDLAPGAPLVLVVDDDAEIRSVVSQVLQFEGYEVEQAADGAEAISIIQRRRPRLVLLDMRMPVMNGWAFVHELRVRGIEVPIVVMTAANDARKWAIEIHAQGYLAKPFDLTELLAAVSKLSN